MENQQSPVLNQTPLPESMAKVATVQSGSPSAPSRDNSMVLIVIVLILIISGGMGFYIFNLKATQKAAQTATTSSLSITPSPIETAETSTTQPDQDLTSLTVEETAGDFDYIATDLKALE